MSGTVRHTIYRSWLRIADFIDLVLRPVPKYVDAGPELDRPTGNYLRIASRWDENGNPVKWLDMRNVHPLSACADQVVCVIHRPSEHHMRRWPLLWRSDRYPGLFERICPHGVGHPDPDQFEHWAIAFARWRPPLSADVVNDHYGPENPYAGIAIHGCDGCCAGDGS